MFPIPLARPWGSFVSNALVRMSSDASTWIHRWLLSWTPEPVIFQNIHINEMFWTCKYVSRWLYGMTWEQGTKHFLVDPLVLFHQNIPAIIAWTSLTRKLYPGCNSHPQTKSQSLFEHTCHHVVSKSEPFRSILPPPYCGLVFRFTKSFCFY
jgi:hypothetical protein